MSDSNARKATTEEVWRFIRFLARHVFCCWPRRWAYDFPRRDARDLFLYRRTCLRCGLIHERRA